MARAIGKKNLFFTSRCFLLFHFSQSIIFWSISIIFPLMSYLDCERGFMWMSHIAIAIYLVLIFVFDIVFYLQYIEKQSIKLELKQYYGIIKEEKSKVQIINSLISGLYSILLTQLGLLTLYSNICFIVIARYESTSLHLPVSLVSFGLTILPKLYAYSLIFMLLFTCVREEDRRRKLAFRALLLNDFRMHSANIEYVEYEKQKCLLKSSLFYLVISNIPFMLFEWHYLNYTDCGLKQDNPLVYISLILNAAYLSINFFFRLIPCTYFCKRLRAYG